ncbi:MAG TPA: hypothetical protein VK909_23735 [Anaerolineales bacterium]|nr:hypothetical protein [Anaerolineales bacterium]
MNILEAGDRVGNIFRQSFCSAVRYRARECHFTVLDLDLDIAGIQLSVAGHAGQKSSLERRWRKFPGRYASSGVVKHYGKHLS